MFIGPGKDTENGGGGRDSDLNVMTRRRNLKFIRRPVQHRGGPVTETGSRQKNETSPESPLGEGEDSSQSKATGPGRRLDTDGRTRDPNTRSVGPEEGGGEDTDVRKERGR